MSQNMPEIEVKTKKEVFWDMKGQISPEFDVFR